MARVAVRGVADAALPGADAMIGRFLAWLKARREQSAPPPPALTRWMVRLSNGETHQVVAEAYAGCGTFRTHYETIARFNGGIAWVRPWCPADDGVVVPKAGDGIRGVGVPDAGASVAGCSKQEDGP